MPYKTNATLCGACSKKKLNSFDTKEDFCSSCLVGPLMFAGASVTGIAVSQNRFKTLVIWTILLAATIIIIYKIMEK
jgi:hypothetical protein